MEFFTKTKAVRLKSHINKYLIADNDQISTRQSRSGATRKSRWLVELVDNNHHILRLKSCYNRYLTASSDPFLFRTTGHKVLQTLPENRATDFTIEWRPIRDGFQVKLKASQGTYLRANGGAPPWRNSVTHDNPHATATRDCVLWDVEAVEVPEDEAVADYLSMVSSFSSISDGISGLEYEFASPVYLRSSLSGTASSSLRLQVKKVLSYGRKRSVILEAPKSDPECVLGNILAAHFLCSTDPSRAPAFIDEAKSHLEHASSYEKAVFEALIYLISPDRDDDLAVELHCKLLLDFPKDLVSLKRAQVLCFYMGRPDLSLELVEQVLPINDNEDYIFGMVAFPLLELGRIGDAEKAGKKGYEINKDDTWSQHALCHVYQYECRFKEAVDFMNNCSRSWGSLSSFMYTHNWWHVALCYLEACAPMEKIREIYDEHIWKELERSDAMAPEVYLNAAGLLLRVFIRGARDIFEDRLNILANCVVDQTFWFLEWHLDILILWALSSTGESNKAEDLLEGLKSRVCTMSKKKQQIMQRGLLLAEAIYKYGRGDYHEALELFGQDFNAIDYKIIGASDEQIDVFTEVHISLLIETGETPKAIQAIKKQLKKREGAPFLWYLLEKASSISGKEEAASYGKKAKELEATYFT